MSVSLKDHVSIACVSLTLFFGCGRFDDEPDPYDLDFKIPRTEDFRGSLSSYRIYEEPLSSLIPTEGALLYELSSELFTDYAYKQRLMVIPEDQMITRGDDGALSYPEGTILVKTFYYPNDMSDPEGERQILETRLLVKRGGTWNVATYLWNEDQTDATLSLDGAKRPVSWINESGQMRSTSYEVPHEGECVTCHQSRGASRYIGPTMLNLNRTVRRDGAEVNQLNYLADQGALSALEVDAEAAMPNYKDDGVTLSQRARAYLEINCAHCHQPNAWSEASASSSERRIDLRYTTPLNQTGISQQSRAIQRRLQSGEMPFLGTTLLHGEGVKLILDYLKTL